MLSRPVDAHDLARVSDRHVDEHVPGGFVSSAAKVRASDLFSPRRVSRALANLYFTPAPS